MSEIATGAELDDFGPEAQPYARAATAWSRLWARLADVQILVFASSFALGWLLPDFVSRPVFQDTAGGYVLVLILLPVVLAIDALIHATFGTTVGKLIAGIRLETIRHEPLKLSLALQRNAQLYLKGLAAGIPLLNLIAYSKSQQRLSEGRQTSWDEALDTRVFNVSGNSLRTTACFLIIVSLNVAGKMIELNAATLAASGTPTTKDFVEAAAIVNAKFPTQVDEITRADRVEYSPNGLWTYFYTFVDKAGARITQAQLGAVDRAKLGGVLRHAYCTSDGMKPFKGAGLTVKHVYREFDGAQAASYTLKPSDCASAP